MNDADFLSAKTVNVSIVTRNVGSTFKGPMEGAIVKSVMSNETLI